MPDASSAKLPRPKTSGPAWASFVGSEPRGRAVRGLEEEGNPKHRLRVEHDRNTLLIHLSGEAGPGWTTLAIDRATRAWSIAQRRTQKDSARAAYEGLYGADRAR